MKSILAAGLAIAVALVGLTVTNQVAAAKKIYRCVDDKKNVTVSDTPCASPASEGGSADKSSPASSPADVHKKDAKDAKDSKGGSGTPAPKADSTKKDVTKKDSKS